MVEMKDFNNNGNIDKIVINDHSNTNIYKPLSQCNIDELQHEYKHRQNLLNSEIKQKKRRYRNVALFVAFVATAFAIWNYFNGYAELSKFIIAIGGFIAPILIYLQSSERQSEFEIRQIKVLNEIIYLLRERDF